MSLSESASDSMLDHALGYLAGGRPVFPVCSPTGTGRCFQHGACQHPGKVPLIAWQPLQERLPTMDEVSRWWSDGRPNIGMATGKLSGVVVLDADGTDARKEAMRRGVPRTPAVWTGKPGGAHYHLAHPGEPVRNFARKLPGLDFRGDGGYVLLPPSRHELGSVYRWAEGTTDLPLASPPAWLLDLLRERSNGLAVGGEHEPLDLSRILQGIPEGERDDTLWRYACKLRADDVPLEHARTLVAQAARLCRPSFDESAAVEKVERAWREYLPTPRLVVPQRIVPESVPASEYGFQTLAELLARADYSHESLVEGLLWEGQVHWIFSPVNAGKTLLMIALGLHIAAGRPFCDRFVRQGPVLFIEEDSSLAKFAEYAEKLAELFEINVDGIPFRVNAVQGLRLISESDLRASMAVVAGLEQPPLVMFFDACESLVPTEKYTMKEMDYLRRYLLWLVDRRITPVMADHTKQPVLGKNGKELIRRDPMDDLFGGTAKKRIADFALALKGSLKNGSLTGTFAKARGEVPDPVEFTYADDVGFEIVNRPPSVRTDTEHRILRWLNNNHPTDWHSQPEILGGAGVPDRSGRRALDAMTRRKLLEKQLEADRLGAFYRVAQGQGMVHFR